jgi:ribonuclease BN (tRNA processing enzyme)
MDLEALARQGFPMEFADLFKQVRTEVADVGRIAARPGMPTLVLSHFVPATRTTAPERWIERIEKDYDGRIIVAEDLMRMPVAKPSVTG